MKRLIAIGLLLFSSAANGQTTPLSNMTATFNDGGTVFNAIKMDIANTASAAGSTALWLGFSATPVFRVETDGEVFHGDIIDSAGLELVKFSETASAINEITIANAAIGGSPSITATGDDTNIPLTLAGKGTGNILAPDGTLTLPTYAFSAAPGSGFFRDTGTGHIRFSIAGVQKFGVTAFHLTGTQVGSLQMRLTDPSIADLPYAFVGDSNLGMYRPASDTLGLVTAGVEGIRIGPAQEVTFTPGASVTGLDIQLDATPGDSLAITDSGLANVFLIEADGDVFHGDVIDSAGLELVKFSETVSAVNEITIANASTTNGPTISATGGDINIPLNLTGKGTGAVLFPDGASGTPSVAFSAAPTTGMFRDTGTGHIRFSVSGQKIGITSAHLTGTATGTLQSRLTDPSIADLSYAFVGDSNTGMYRPSANNLALVTNGVEGIRIGPAQQVGIGTSLPEGDIHVVGASFPVAVFEGTTAVTAVKVGTAKLKATTSGDMADGFGMVMTFNIEDTSAVDNIIADLGAARDGADNSGSLLLRPYLAGVAVDAMILTSAGLVGINDTGPAAQLDITATASTVGLNVAMDATPGSAITVNDSTATEVFEITSLGHVNVGGGAPIADQNISIDVTGEIAILNIESQDSDAALNLDSGGASTDSVINFQKDTGLPVFQIFYDGSGSRLRISDPAFGDYIAFDRSPRETELNSSDVDIDFRAGAVGESNAFFIQGSNGFVGFGTGTPTSAVEMANDKLFALGVDAGLTASTTQTQAGGLDLTAQVNEVATVANNSDTVVLPPLPATGSLTITIINNDSAESIRVFPASGDDLGAGGDTADAANIPAGVVRKYISYDATNWVKYISE